MKKLNLLLVFLVVLSLVLVVDADAVAVKKKKMDPPQLSVMMPRQGQSVVGNAITLQVMSDNVKIRDGRSGRRNKPNEGHLSVIVDSGKAFPVYTTTHRLNIAALSEGEHKLVIELVENEGNSFEPKVVRELSFNVVRSALRAGGLPRQTRVVHPARLFTNQRI